MIFGKLWEQKGAEALYVFVFEMKSRIRGTSNSNQGQEVAV